MTAQGTRSHLMVGAGEYRGISLLARLQNGGIGRAPALHERDMYVGRLNFALCLCHTCAVLAVARESAVARAGVAARCVGAGGVHAAVVGACSTLVHIYRCRARCAREVCNTWRQECLPAGRPHEAGTHPTNSVCDDNCEQGPRLPIPYPLHPHLCMMCRCRQNPACRCT